jgi:acyl-CoA thioester hydrolase
MPEAPRSSPETVTPITVYYFDTDAGGVVHNVAYLRMVEVARTELSQHLGWSVKEMDATGLVPVVARTEIDYLKPARLGDALEIHGRLVGMEKIRFYFEFTILRPEGNQRIAFCRQTMVTVQLPNGRPQPTPEPWRTAFPNLLLP